MSGSPDPKPYKTAKGALRLARKRRLREIDPDAFAKARSTMAPCAACGGRPSNVHHVVPKGSPYFGDDLVENFVLLCGTGTTGCHGAFHGNPYLHVEVEAVRSGSPARTVGQVTSLRERRDREWVAGRIGRTITASRPDTVAYVLRKLGDGPGRDFLRRRYLIEDA